MAPAKKDAMHIFENRLSSFTAAHQRRLSSTAKKKADPLTWPHPEISIEKLARAGLFYQPTVGNQDNCVCYLCEKNLANWEEDDDPALEHAHHAPFCGWARIHAMMVKRNRNKNAKVEEPQGEEMLEARKATFGKWWPHTARPQMPQIESLAKAGFHFYASKNTSADNVACGYCELELDGWEDGDDPWKEHLKRSEDCLFFTWTEPKKSRASRTSMVSAARAKTPQLSSGSVPPEPEEPAPAPAPKKRGGRPKKASSKGSKKSESVAPEPAVVEEPEQKPKARGRKRASSIASNLSVDDPASAAPKRPRARSTSRARAPRTTRSSISMNPDNSFELAPTSETFQEPLDDNEIERRLLADLDRPMSDEEDALATNLWSEGISSMPAEDPDHSIAQDDPDMSIASKRGLSNDDESIQPPKKRGRAQRASKTQSRTSETTKSRAKKVTKGKGKAVETSTSDAIDANMEDGVVEDEPKAVPSSVLLDDRVKETAEDLRHLRVDPDGGVVLFDGGGESDSSSGGPEVRLVRAKPAPKAQKKAPVKKQAQPEPTALPKSKRTKSLEKQAPVERSPIRANQATPEHTRTIATMEVARKERSIPSSPQRMAQPLVVAHYTPPGQIASKPAANGWAPIDIDEEFAALAATEGSPPQGPLTREECDLTVAEWVKRNAQQSELRVMRACEDTVNLLNVHSRRALEAVESL